VGGAPIVVILVVLGAITAMGVFFDFLSKAAARAAKEARERAQQERAARASGQPPPAPRRQDAPPAIVELERYLRNLVEPDGQQGQGQGGGVFAPVPREQAPRQVPVARVVRAQPAARPPQRSTRRIDAEQQSGHLEDHHLGTNIEGRRFEGEVERRHVVPTGGTLEGHHLRTQLSEVAGAMPTPVSQGTRGGLARLEAMPLMARAVALAEIFGPPPGLGRASKGPRRRFTRAVDA
jgi:hypothetical protein